jgi:hypothetical protein
LERGERPGAGAIRIPIRRAPDFAQDSLGFNGPIPLRLPAAMAGPERCQSGAIELRHQVCDRIATRASGGPRRVGVGLTGSDGKESFGTGNERGGFGLGATQPFQGGLLLGGQETKRVLLGSGHGKTPRETRHGQASPSSHSPRRMAILNTSDPLVVCHD